MRATGSWRAGVLVAFAAARWPLGGRIGHQSPRRRLRHARVLVPGAGHRSSTSCSCAKENRASTTTSARSPTRPAPRPVPNGPLLASGGGVDTFTMQAAPDPMPQDVAHSNGTWRGAYHDGAMDGFCHEGGAIVESTGKDIADTQMKAGDPQLLGLREQVRHRRQDVRIVARQLRQQRVRRRGPDRPLRHHARTASHPQQPLRRRLGARGSDLGLRRTPGTRVRMIDLQGARSEVFPCFRFKALPNIMDDAGVSWRYYGQTSHWIHSGIAAIDSIRCAQATHRRVSSRTRTGTGTSSPIARSSRARPARSPTCRGTCRLRPAPARHRLRARTRR